MFVYIMGAWAKVERYKSGEVGVDFGRRVLGNAVTSWIHDARRVTWILRLGAEPQHDKFG